jgi:hypothetical protein
MVVREVLLLGCGVFFFLGVCDTHTRECGEEVTRCGKCFLREKKGMMKCFFGGEGRREVQGIGFKKSNKRALLLGFFSETLHHTPPGP